ncbi:MAG: glycosyltransferase family 4 protein [Acidimicrobiia bacterium]
MTALPPLRVGILADTVDHPGGIGRYVREVLAACSHRDDVALVVATPTASVGLVTDLTGPALVDVVCPPRADQLALALWDRFRAGPVLERAGAEVVIGCKHLVPRTALPTVLVVHDVLTITRADENPLAKRLLLPRQYRASLTAATRLVAVSAATRDRLAALDARWAAKCDVVPNGMSAHLTTVEPVPVAAVGSARFALAVGDLSPRKNLGLLTRIWRDAPPGDLLLVVVGPDAGGDAAARADLLALQQAGRAVWIRGAGDAVLRWCYEQATVVVFPTHEEGFGLPLLEAMTFGAPVVASTDAALREVAAGAAGVVHIDADATDAWRRAITTSARAIRVASAPVLPPHAIGWEEHTARLLAIAGSLARPRA